jgi:fructosamine-3-kinase
VAFFRERRLRYQLDLAGRNGYSGRLSPQADELLERLDRFFTDYQPVPSLLHGDLWGGNWAAAAGGEPVIFDPAVYYGDREADLAMTRLFGGFGAGFYAAYEAAWPTDAGARTRGDLYNLYHVLNHVNLFGDGYIPQARAIIRGLLAQLR